MAHDVFISYAVEDKRTADIVCKALEEKGIRCWYAPRNVPYGMDFEEAIIDAICSSRLIILIVSSHSNKSPHVKREVQNACAEGTQIPILPFRVEDISLNKALKYYLGSSQWLDASTLPLENHLQPLVEHVRVHLPQQPEPQQPKPPQKQPARFNLRLFKTIAISSLTVMLVILLAAWVELFNLLNIDNWLERKFISYMDGRVDKRFSANDLRLILAEENRQGDVPSGDSEKIHRRYHAELVDALAAAQAKVVAFDINFEGDTEWDEQFAQAIKKAQESGTRIVVGVGGVENGQPKAGLPEKLRDPLQNSWGNTEIEMTTASEGPVLKMQLAQKITHAPAEERAEIPVITTFALQVIRQAQDQPSEAFFNTDDSEIHLRQGGLSGQKIKSIPVDEQMNLTLDLAEQTALNNITHYYQEVYANRSGNLNDFRNKIVLVGYRKGDLHDVADSVKRYGVEIHANAISNILQEVYIYHLRPTYNFLVIFLMGLTGALVHTRIGNRLQYKIVIDPKIIKTSIAIPVTLLVISAIYFVIVFMVYKQYRLVLDMAYHIAALFSLYWVVGSIVKRAGLQASQKEVTP